MNRVAYVKPNFPVDAFVSTATYYLRYRVPYPEGLLKDLVTRAGITGKGRLLDLACGPGRVALALVASFQEIWAIDLEPEMIAVGQAEAAQRSVNHIRWMVGKAEDLETPPASCELITINATAQFRALLTESAPNRGVQPTASSVRCAPASGSADAQC